jgi:membrane associated rhomboid family serine protease
VVLSLYCLSNRDAFDKLCLVPEKINNDPSQRYRLISHAFIHADLGHLLFNMLTLYFFGTELEGGILSEGEYVIFYLVAILLSSLPSYQQHKHNPDYVAVGASGAVSAVMFALVLFSPWSVIYIKFIIPIYFILFAVGYLGYSYYQSKNNQSNIAHDVHMWGALFGLAYMLIVHPSSLRTFLDQMSNAPFLN